MAQQLNPDKKFGDLQFYKFPFLELSIALTPQSAVIDLEYLLQLSVTDEISAAAVLQKLIDTGRKAGVQIFISVEYPESALPEVHRLTHAIFSLEKRNDIYLTPQGGGAYQKTKLFQLFGM